ncbi:MAG TPA: PilZ domain-containing protein [Burkholderiales bacterium]|nr:PilZ domain-containing protein [Burkholderiales bacterium]
MSRDRRKYVRHEVDYSCWLRPANAAQLMKAHVRNISEGGAKVACPPDAIPDTVEMLMTQDGKVGRRCKVVWRSDDAVGLMFVAKAGARSMMVDV